MVAEEIDRQAVERDLNPDYERAIDVEFASFDWNIIRRSYETGPLPYDQEHATVFRSPVGIILST